MRPISLTMVKAQGISGDENTGRRSFKNKEYRGIR
jgi:hypothetical protein